MGKRQHVCYFLGVATLGIHTCARPYSPTVIGDPRPTHWDRNKMAAILLMTFSNWFSDVKIIVFRYVLFLKAQLNKSPLIQAGTNKYTPQVQVMAWRRTCAYPRPQWVNIPSLDLFHRILAQIRPNVNALFAIPMQLNNYHGDKLIKSHIVI